MSNTKINKTLNFTFVISILGQIICFFLPSIIQQLYDDSTGKVFDGFVFYGFQNFFYYVNVLFLFIFSLMIFKRGSFQKYIFLLFAILYLVLYFWFVSFLVNSPFGATPINSNIGIGYVGNLIFTFIYFVILFLKGILKKEIEL